MRRLREHRKDAGLTQVQLAELAGVHQTHVSKLEIGRCPRPSHDIVTRLARALNVSPDQLSDTSDVAEVHA